MRYSRVLFAAHLAVISACSPLCFSEEGRMEEQKRANFRAAYDGQRADRRLAAIRDLDNSHEQRSIEMLYSVSWRDPDPEVRSRAFFALVRCEDTYGYTAYLAADSFKRETEPGVKVEKAVGLGSLRYKWSALNELVDFLHTTRWNSWQWTSNESSGGYVAAGSPPTSPGDAEKTKTARSGYDEWKNREPLRWHSENELIGLITSTINRMSGTQMEARPRIDQEIVKWWERKSDLWAEYDRNLRSKALGNSHPIDVKDFKAMNDGIQTGSDTLGEIVSKTTNETKEGAPIKRTKAPLSGPSDE
jgi:hypothetical protein